MSQDEIVAWLQKNPGWHAVVEFDVIGISRNSAYRSCARMRKNKRVNYKVGPNGIWLYRAKGGKV